MFSAKKSQQKVNAMNHSEKSQKMHSINHRADVLLQKQIQNANRDEKDVVCAITVDQRIVSTRFRNKLTTSCEAAKRHEKILTRFQHLHSLHCHDEVTRRTNPKAKDVDKSTISSPQGNEIALNTTNFSKISDFKTGESKLLNDEKYILHNFRRSDSSHGRPQTALEVKNKQWHKRTKSANERLVRAKSAPLYSWRNSSEILKTLNIQTGGFYQANNLNRPLSRDKFFEIFDIEEFRKFRELETAKEHDKVKRFMNSVEPVILVPWEPGVPIKETKEEPELVGKINRRAFSAFISRTESSITI